VADPRPGRRLPGEPEADPPAGPCVYLEVTARAPAADVDCANPSAPEPRPARIDLALAAVVGATRGQGAAVEVDPSAPGQSSVRVLFPIHSAAPPQVEDDQAAGTILLLCQDADSLAVTDRILEHFGLTVLSTSDAAEARAILRSRGHAVDAVLLDADPGELPAELVAELARPDLSLILATAEESSPAAPAPLGLDPAAFLTKPFTGELLIRTVRGVLHAGRGFGGR
jgi:CheY-like chemotaxis protein